MLVWSIRVSLRGRGWRTGMRLNTVMFAESLVKVQMPAVDGDVHAAVVKGRHRGGRQRDVI